MKLSNSSIGRIDPLTARPTGRMSAIAAYTVMLAITSWTAHAQSAANFDIPAPPVESSTQEKPAASVPSGQSDITKLTASRYVGEADLEPYIASFTARFSMRRRDTDPFGQVQDPDAKPVIKTPIARSPRAAPMQATPFADIIRLIKVTTVMPSERQFLIGTRSIKQGDRIPLSFRGRNLDVEVVSVSSRSIDFRNVENGETAELSLNMLPPGMKPGNDGINAPGMMADNPNAPIALDGNPLPLNSVQLR